MEPTLHGPVTWAARLLDRWSGVDRLAVLTPEVEWSGADLLARSRASGAWLLDQGFAPGDAVPALLDTDPTALALAVGGALARRPLAPLGPRLTVDELAGALRRVAAPAIVASAPHLERAEAVARAAGADARLVDDVGADGPEPTAPPAPDDVAVVLHTSGTTGAPKRVDARQAALLARTVVYDSVMPMGADDRFCSASPFHHTTGITMALTALAQGATVLPMPRFSPEAWRSAGRLAASHLLVVPTMIDQLLAVGALSEASPRVLLYGAAPIHPDTLREARSALPSTELIQVFGQTEGSPLTHLTHADHLRGLEDRPDRLGSVGRAVPGAELWVDQPDAEGIGELVARGDHLFATGPGGARHTGDLGRIDAEGYVTLHGRSGDRIVWAGENVHPAEVEAVLRSHPAVREVAVVGVPDRRYGELVRAVVVPLDPASPPTPEELRAHASDRLARFKVPSEVRFVEALPRNAAGKVMRPRLRDGPGQASSGAR